MSTTDRGPQPMMAAARAVAEDPTRELAGDAVLARLRRPAGDPIDDLTERVLEVAPAAVDTMQVAAALESDGVTDRVAAVGYGYPDVFALADEVFHRLDLGGGAKAPAGPTSTGPGVSALRDIAHGALYLLPAAVFPAALALIGLRSLVLGVVLAGCLGWVWAGGATWLAYRLLGRGHVDGAGRVLRWSALAGLPAAAALGTALVLGTGAGFALAALAVGQMAFQMASAVLVFYRREGWLFAAMAPATVGGLAYLYAGPRLLAWSVAAAAISVAAALVVAVHVSTTGGVYKRQSGEPPLRRAVAGELGTLPIVLVYSLLSAVFLLHAQARYMLDRFDLALTALPLIVGMGVVEHRARRFRGDARALLWRVRYPRQFVPRVWLLLLGNAAGCMAAIAALAIALLAAFQQRNLLSPAAVAMTAAYVSLAGAYYLSFILAGEGRYGWLCGGLAAATALHLGLSLAAPAGSTPLADTTAFLCSAVLLQLLFLAALTPVMRQVWRFK